MSPEEKAAHNEKQRQYYLRMTPEEKAVYLAKKRSYYESMSPEDREVFRQKNLKAWYDKLGAMSPEELAAYRREAAERTRKKYANMSPEQRALQKEYSRQRYLSMTPEERAIQVARQRERRASMSPEKRAAYLAGERDRARQKYRSMTPAERAAYLDKQSQRRALKREKIERAKLGVLAYFTKKEIEDMREEERIRRERMTQEEIAEDRQTFNAKLSDIISAPDFPAYGRLSFEERRAIAAFVAGQKGTRYEAPTDIELDEEYVDEEDLIENAIEEMDEMDEMADFDEMPEFDEESEDDEDSREPNPGDFYREESEDLWGRIARTIKAGPLYRPGY
jgi:hypothetical protein